MPKLTISLTAEQDVHVQAAVSAFNSSHGTKLTSAQWAKTVIQEAVASALVLKAGAEATAAVQEKQSADWSALTEGDS